MLSFLFVEEGKLFIKKSSFEEFNLVFFTVKRIVRFKMQPRQQSFGWSTVCANCKKKVS